MAAAEPTAEQRELTLVGKVEMRIALADTDSKLETILKTYLAPLLLKLASPHEPVRKKVIGVCQHINTRVQPKSIQLPVEALVKQFREQESPLIRHFDLLYIQQGVIRLANTEKANLLPFVINGISKATSQDAQIFYLLLRLLPSFNIPPRGGKEDMEMKTILGVSSDDTQYLAAKLGRFLLFTPQKASNASMTCPGLTSDEYSFFNNQNKDEWNAAAGGLNILQTKVLVAKLLASGLFDDKERFIPAVIASADPAYSIRDIGDDMLKRALPANDLEEEHLVKTLYDLYFGQGNAPGVRPPLRLKILNLFGKSVKSTTFAHHVMKLVDDGVTGSSQDGEDIVMSNAPTQNANIGREATKLRSAIFTYINFVARLGSKETLQSIASRVVSRLRDFIENQGWPKAGVSEDLVSRAYAYEVIGLLAKAGPRGLLVEEEQTSLDLLRWLFDSLARDSSGNSITVSIEESLSTVLGAMGQYELQKDEEEVLEALLIDQMTMSNDLDGNKRLRSTRYVAVRFANRCLPYESVKARWVDILAVGATNDRDEVREEGERGLSPYWYRMLNGSSVGPGVAEIDFPPYELAMQEFFVVQTSITSTDPDVIARRARETHETSFAAMTAFARRLLIQQALLVAGIAMNVDTEWERRLDTLVESDMSARDAVKDFITKLCTSKDSKVHLLVCALFECVAAKTASAQSELVEFLALSPDSLIKCHLDRAKSLIPIVKSNHHERRLTSAHVFGILASHSNADTANIIPDLLETAVAWKSAVGSNLNAVHGVLIALGYYFSRSAYRNRHVPHSGNFSIFLKVMFDIFTDSKDDLLIEATHMALGQMCMFDCLTSDMLGTFLAPVKISDKLYEKAKDGKEAAILCLGQVAMVLPEGGEDLRHVEENLHKLHEIRQSEIHFTVGESLSYVAAGWQSQALATKLDIQVDTDRALGQPRSDTLTKLLDRVLSDCANTKPALKKAAVIWLLCLVQFCGELFQGRLSECQTAFRRCLSDRDELVQESASRGLGLVYEKGDRKLKDELVRQLVNSFSSDKQQLAGNVSAETELFEPGALPTGDGSVSTYKDIMSLAAEVGDSSLVYKFMSMASSNAIWSSRAAFGKFGLSRVLSDSSVDGYLSNNPKLYPKLFRYRFDPNTGVQRSMNEIWNALVPDSNATIDKHFDAIMEDLLDSVLGREWRVRQACCGAIADLVQGRTLDKYEQYLERIWTQCFKVLDDIKDSVRVAAAFLARTLTGVLTRSLEADHGATKNASLMLKHVLPFLLSSSSMESSVKEVQTFSVTTLLEIIEKANGATLRPFIPELVERLIGLLSSLEPEAINYVHLNASKYNLTEQKIDDMRLSSVRSSPLMEAIEKLLDLLDENIMKQLYPLLGHAMKNAVGLPSKVGSSRVLVSLATRRMVIFRPYADETLKLIERLVVDRNDTVCSSYAVAAAYVARGASDKAVTRLIDFAKKLYFESEGDRESATPRRAITSGELMYGFAKNASDKFNAFATLALPFVFVGKHDSHEHVKEQFQETWNEAVAGSRAVQLYLKEILEICMVHLDSRQWTLKHTSAWTVADCVVSASAAESSMTVATGSALWPAIEKALGGKTWEGKEVVLSSFAKFVEVAKAYYVERESVCSAITKIAIREAKRQNAAYRQHSIQALARIALARTDVDMFELVFDVVDPILHESPDEDAMEIDGRDSGRKAEEIKEATVAGAIEAIFAAISPDILDGGLLNHQLSRALREVASTKAPSSAAIWRSTFEGLKSLFDRIRKQERQPETEGAATKDLREILFGPVVSIEAVRMTRAEAVSKMPSSLMTAGVVEDIRAMLKDEPSQAVRQVLEASLKGATASS